MEVRRNEHREIALELHREDGFVDSIRFRGGDKNSGLALLRDSVPVFDREFNEPVMIKGRLADPVDFARVHLRETAKNFALPDEVLDALRDIMSLPHDERLYLNHMHILVDCDTLDVVGYFEHHDDAVIVAYSFMFATYVVGSAADLSVWPQERLVKFRDRLLCSETGSKKVPPPTAKELKNLVKFSEGVWKMAKTAKNPPVTKKAAAPKTEKVASTKRSDGPCGVVHAYLDANKDDIKSGKLTKKAAVAALVAKGINSSTAGIQSGKWMQKNPGYVFIKPEPAAKEPKVVKAPKVPAEKKTVAKKTPAAKKAPAKKAAVKKAKTAPAQAAA